MTNCFGGVVGMSEVGEACGGNIRLAWDRGFNNEWGCTPLLPANSTHDLTPGAHLDSFYWNTQLHGALCVGRKLYGHLRIRARGAPKGHVRSGKIRHCSNLKSSPTSSSETVWSFEFQQNRKRQDFRCAVLPTHGLHVYACSSRGRKETFLLLKRKRECKIQCPQALFGVSLAL